MYMRTSQKNVTCVTIMGSQGQRHTRNQQKSSGNDIIWFNKTLLRKKVQHTNTDCLSQSKVNTQYRIMTSTGPNNWFDNHDRLGLTTGWVKSLIYTKNTRSCIMTSTGYYRLPFNPDRLLPATLYTFYPAG